MAWRWRSRRRIFGSRKALAGRAETRGLLGVTGVGAIPGGKANKRVLGAPPDAKISGCSLDGVGVAKCGNTRPIVRCGDGD